MTTTEMTAVEAMLVLGRSRADFIRLVQQGKLAPSGTRGRRRSPVYDADDVRALAATVLPPGGSELKVWGHEFGRGGPSIPLIRAWNRAHPERPFRCAETFGEVLHGDSPDPMRHPCS